MDSDKGTAHETVSFGDLGDAGRRHAGGRVRKPLWRLLPPQPVSTHEYVSAAQTLLPGRML
jgi:hypothetical protein